MTLAIQCSEADKHLLQSCADFHHISISDFVREAALKRAEEEKSIRNAEYLAMLERGFKQAAESEGTYFTDEELRNLVYGN